MICYKYFSYIISYFSIQRRWFYKKIPNTDNPSNDITSLSYHLSYTINNFFNTSLCFSDQSIFVIYSPTIFLNLLLFVIFNVLHQFSAYVLRSGSTYCMVYNHGWCEYLFPPPSIKLLHLLSWLFCGVIFML